MEVAALVGSLRQSLAQRRPEAGVIVGDDELDAVQTARLEPEQKLPQLDRLARLASSTANTWRHGSRPWAEGPRPSPSMPIPISTAWLVITPASRTRARIR